MTPGVWITLIICSTFLILFAIALFGGNRSKKEKELYDYLSKPIQQQPPTWKHEIKGKK